MAHSSLRSHRKLIRLVTELGVPRAHAYGILGLLWDSAYADYQVGPDGLLRGWTVSDIGALVDWTGDRTTLVDALVSAGFLDRCGDDFAIHDYGVWAPDYVKSRWRKASVTPEVRSSSKPDRTKSNQTGLVRNQTELDRHTQPNPTQPNSSADAADVADATPGNDAPAKRPRPRSPIWDSVKQIWWAGVPDERLSRTERSRIGKLVRDFGCKADTPEEVVRLLPVIKAAHERAWPNVPVTPESCEKHWRELLNGPAARREDENDDLFERLKREQAEAARSRSSASAAGP